MKKRFTRTNEMRPIVLRHKRRSWFINSTWVMLLLMSTLLWQCEKDTFEGETVGLCPEVISTDPANGATNVVTNKLITATFNEAMLPASINGETYTIKEGSVLISGVVTYADKIATFTPTKPLEANKTYTGTVTKKVKDPDGNFPIENYTWSFTTGNVPTVISTDPVSAASSVPLNKIITATFSTAMDPSTINTATFLINQGTNPIAGTIIYTGTTATFTPTSPLVDNKVYTGTITIGAKDVVGNALATHYKWSFSTAQTQYTINLSSNPAEGGSTSGGGMFNKDDQTTVVAVPSTGYTFTNWTEGANIVSTNSNYALTATSNRTLVANFGINTYSLTVTATNGSVTKVPNQTTFNYGTSVLITAIPNTGYSFTGWTGDATGTSNSITVMMNSNKNITANFALIPPNNYTLNVTATLGGTTAKNPNQTAYVSGTVVQVTATPNTGYTFTGWSGDASGSTNPLSVTMNANKNIVANFTVIPTVTYSLNVTANNGVVVKNPNQANYNQGTTVLLTATPNTGYAFTGWSGDATGKVNPLVVTMNSNKNITAIFTLIPANTYTLNVTALNGNVDKNPDDVSYDQGTAVQLTATPDLGYTFTGWSGDATGTANPLTITMSSNKNITAIFTMIPLDTYTLNVIAVNGNVVKNPNQVNYTDGTTVQLTATPNSGYTFTGWSGNATGSANPLTINMNSNKNITAIFTMIPLDTYTLNVTAVNGNVVKNPNQVNYTDGTTVQLTATPNSGYAFTGWSGDATGSANPLTVTMNSNKNISAIFTLIPVNTYTITTIATNGIIARNPNQVSYNQGTTVQLTATPNLGYSFTGWSGDVTGSVNPVTITMNSNKNITATFALIPPVTYILNVTAVNGSVLKNPNQINYNSGTTVQLTATPNVGYTFTGWSGDATGSANPLTVSMNSNKNITAIFTAIPPTTYTLNVTAVNGTVLKNPNTATYNSGSTVQLTATPSVGYIFTSWSGSATGSTNPLTVTMNANKNITANFTAVYTLNVIAVNGTVAKNPNTATYTSGSTVQLTATPSVGYTFTSWSGDASGSINPLTVTMNANKNITANFTAIPPTTYTLNVIAVNGTVLKNPNTPTYNSGATVQLTATPSAGYTFTSWSGDASGSINPLSVIMNSNKNITANFTALPAGPAGIDLGSAGNFAILAGAGVSNTGVTTMINGDVGSFPTATIAGLLPGNVVGILYTTADPIVGLAKTDLTTAFNDAQSRSLDAISLPGQIGGLTLAPGLYVNSTTSGISGTGPQGILTLDAGGNPNAVWIFKVGSTFITDASTGVVLAGGAQAKNIYWSVGTSATLGTNSTFYGNILADQAITLTTGATLTGRALTRVAAVTLDSNSVTKP